jgi:xanthine dehydrogenase/oxidase
MESVRVNTSEINASSTHRYIRRGIALIPTKFGINFGVRHLNQAGALVHIYEDGSILASHAGMEMGQGLHTKMLQVVAHELNVPLEKVEWTSHL